MPSGSNFALQAQSYEKKLTLKSNYEEYEAAMRDSIWRLMIQQSKDIIWAGNKDGIRQCQQFVINFEDSIRRRYEMMQDAAMRDSIGRLMIRQSQDIKKKLK